jgi:GTP1/Obg family GTP-binding protein
VKKVLLTAALACALAISGPAWAQAQPEFSKQQLESFVVAALAVDELIREWNPRIQAAQDDAQAAQLREQANGQLVEAIARTDGITLEQYQQILQAAKADPDLKARIDVIYQEKSGN